MAFKSIDTAPKDETVVLLQVPRSDETDGVRIGWWHEGDWYDNEAASHSVSDMYGAPTGWAPLPDAKVEPTTAEGGMTWQPIETAPKDGTHVLVYSPDGYEERRINIAEWYEHHWDKGASEWIAARCVDGLAIRAPTHWMPLPPPPSPNATELQLDQ